MASGDSNLLIDFDTEDFEVLEVSPVKEEPAQPSPNTSRICGYLEKINSAGLIKGSKRRWFVFDKNTCTLNYFRSHKDPKEMPIGSIPIADCVFTCTAEGLLINSFNITQGTRIHALQAIDQKSMLWWLQELQYERRVFNMQNARVGSHSQALDNKHSEETKNEVSSSESGLLVKETDNQTFIEEERKSYGDSLSLIPVLPRVEHPPETVGLNSVNLEVTKPGTNALSEIGNKMAQIGGGIVKLRPKPARPAPPSPTSVFYAKRYSHSEEDRLNLTPALQQSKAHQKYKRRFEKTSSGVTQLVDKMQNALKTGWSPSQSEAGKQANEFTETFGLLKEEIELMKTSLDSKDETIELLKRELDKLNQLETNSTPDQTNFSTTHQLRSEITAIKLTLEHYRQEAEESKLLLNQEKDKTKMFEEMIEVKDGVVMRLTNELQELGTKSSRKNSRSRSLLSRSDALSSEDSETLKKIQEEVEAYRMQNKFLNNEILELTHLRKVDQEKADLLHEQSLNQEALRCQLHSKYFILLSELDKMKHEEVVHYDDTDDGDPLLKQEKASRPSVVQQLVQEAVRESNGNSHLSALFRSSKYDKYGFIQIIDDDDESTFLAAASRLQQSASNIFKSIEQQDVSLESRWQRYIAERGVQRTAEFKMLVRKGIPHNLRAKVWKSLVHIRTAEIRQQLNGDGTYYQRLCATGAAPLHAKQIDLDLLRTLPNNRYFSEIDSVGIKRLKRVLGAYSLHNPSIGYCQGLNRIAAISLLYLAEEDAFWCLVAIVECIMPDEYYTSTLTASQADQRVFRELLAEKMPQIHSRLEQLGIDVSLITFNWFLCIFCDSVPPDTMLRIWDVFLNESSKVLFRYALAFFKHLEDDILELNEYMTLFNLLRKMVHKMYDAGALTQTAFQGMNPLSMKKVDRLRTFHVEKVRFELRQLDTLRSEFANKHAKASVNSDMLSDDEGEND